MKLFNGKRVIAVLLSVIMLAATLYVPAVIMAEGSDAVTVDYSALANRQKLNMDYYYSELGMLDGAGLNIENGALVTDADWHYQLITDTDIQNEAVNGGYAVYEIASGSDFTAEFTSATDLSKVSVAVSADGVNWEAAAVTADTAADKITVSGKDTENKFVRLTLPTPDTSAAGITAVKYTKASADATKRRVDYAVNKPTENTDAGNALLDSQVYINRGIWQSNSLWYTPHGTLVANYNHLNSAVTANSYNGYVTYKVQPGTRFALTVTANRDASVIAEKLGFENPLDWTVEIYGSADNETFKKIDTAAVASARYANHQNGGDARRAYDFNFIVPDGCVYIKCKLPVTQSLNTLKGKDGEKIWDYIGNDIFEINKVEFTALKYDYYKNGEGDYYIEGDLTGETASNFGITSFGGKLERKSDTKLIDTDWSYQYNNGLSDAHVVYEVEKGTAFYAEFVPVWGPNIQSYAAKQDYKIKLIGWNSEASVWEDATDITVTKDNYDSSKKLYTVSLTAEQNAYSKLKILWPSKIDSADVGDDCLALAGVAFTAPVPDTRSVYDYSDLSSLPLDNSQHIGDTLSVTDSLKPLGMYKLTAGAEGSNLGRINNGVIQPTWIDVWRVAAGQMEFYADYEVKGGTVFTATVNVDNNTTWGKPAWESLECYKGRKFEFKFLTSPDGVNWTLATSTGDKHGQLFVDVEVPANANFVRVLFPQDGNPGGARDNNSKVFNDMAQLWGVRFEKGNYNPYGSNTYGQVIDYTDKSVYPKGMSITAATNAEAQLYDAGISAMYLAAGVGIQAKWEYLDKAKDIPKPYVVYNVVSGTAFQAEVTYNTAAIKSIEAAIGKAYRPKLYISSDNSVWTEYCDSDIEVASSKTRPDRGGNILTINSIPEGMNFVKVELPQDGDASLTGGWPWAGNDIIEIVKVSLTKGSLPDPNNFSLDESLYTDILDFKNDAVNTAKNINAYALDTMKAYGLAGPSYSYFESSGDSVRTKPNVTIAVKEGSAFFTEIQTRPNIYNSFIEGTYDSKLYFSKDALSWEDVTFRYRQRSGAGGEGFGLCERYQIDNLPEGVKYIKIELPNDRCYAGYVTNKGVRLSYIGNDYIGIRKIAFTPKEANTYEHDINYTDIYNKYAEDGIPGDITDTVKSVLGLYDYSKEALTMQSYQGLVNGDLVTRYVMQIRSSYLISQTKLDRCYVTYNVKPNTSFESVMFASDSQLCYSAPNLMMKAYVSPTGQDGTWTEVKDVWAYMVNNELSLNAKLKLTIDNVGANTNFVKIEFPQDGDYGLINPEATQKVGNDFFAIESVKATLVNYSDKFEPIASEDIVFENPNQNFTTVEEVTDYYDNGFDDDYYFDYDEEDYDFDSEEEIEEVVSTQQGKKTKRVRVTKKMLIPDGYTYAVWFIALCIAGGVLLLAGLTALAIILIKKKKRRTA